MKHFIKQIDEKDKKLAELEEKKLALMKEIMFEEIKQSNKKLSEDELSVLAKKIDQTVESTTGKGNDGNNGKGNSGKDNNSSKSKSSDKSSNKSSNGNKGGNGKSKK